MSLSLPEQASTTFSLEDRADHWCITGVPYRGNICPVDLLKTLLDGGAVKTQDEWAEYSRNAVQARGFHVGGFPLYHALFSILFRNKDNAQHREKIGAARTFLKEKFFANWLMTLTRIAYTPSGKDKVTHNSGLPEKYEVQEDIVGLDEWVGDSQNPKLYKAILGTDNISEIQSVYNWITGKNARVWRMNTKPKSVDERVAGFYADSGGAVLDCDGVLQSSDASLGVRFPSAEGAQKIEAQNIETYTPQQIATALQTLRLSGLEQQLFDALKEQRR